MKYPACAAILALVTTVASPLGAQGRNGVVLAPHSGIVSTQSGLQGNYMTTADGCSYRRTKAPGYAERWILILNPHHIGRPNAHRGCRGML